MPEAGRRLGLGGEGLGGVAGRGGGFLAAGPAQDVPEDATGQKDPPAAVTAIAPRRTMGSRVVGTTDRTLDQVVQLAGG